MMWRRSVGFPYLATAFVAGLLGHPASAEGPLCSPFVEDHPGWNTATLRPHTDAFRECALAEDAYTAVVRGWLEGRAPGGEPLKSLGLGRLVSYPWLSAVLAETASSHSDWNSKRGRSRSGDINGLVASILSSEEVLARLDAPFEGSGYRVTGVSVEKVLVAPAAQVLPGYPHARELLPYDAQTWLVLAFDP